MTGSRQPMIEPEARPAEPRRPRLDRHRLAEEHGRAERNFRLGQDQSVGSTRLALERLARGLLPPGDPRALDVREVEGVVDVAHRVRVPEPDLDLDPMPEVAGQVAGIRLGPRADDAIASAVSPCRHGTTTSRPTIPASAWPSTEQTIRYVPGVSSRNRIRCVWPGRAVASTFSTPSTIQSWNIGSSLTNRTTANRPASIRMSAGVKRRSRAWTSTECADASMARSAATTPPARPSDATATASRYQPRRSRARMPRGRGRCSTAGRASKARSRSEFVTTATDDRAIAAAARAGLRVTPSGTRAPMATGIRTTL